MGPQDWCALMLELPDITAYALVLEERVSNEARVC
ncbi:MAG: hypothetical protein ACI9XK_003106 [Granulosicoccus sp.]|jgi:hypothetical protein